MAWLFSIIYFLLHLCMCVVIVQQGPQATLYMSQLLVWSALCEVKRSQEHCLLLEANEVNQAQRLWLAYLTTRRDIFSIPAANCYGYTNSRREEAKGVDPNRDFPYSRKDDNCFKTATARLFNAIMSTSLTQLVVTFHGGMVAIGYEWVTSTPLVLSVS